MKIMRIRCGTFLLRVGPWQIGLSLPDGGRYGNGSRWQSGWHRWADEVDW